MPVGWIQVAVYDSAEAAHAAKGLLEAEGIEARLSNEHFAAITQLPTPVVGQVELSALDADADRALELIHSHASLDVELPLDDEYEPYDPYREPIGRRDNRRSWQLLAILLFGAAAFLTFRDRGADEAPVRGTFYDRAAVSTYVVIHLPRSIDHLDKSEIDLILELDLEYIDTLEVTDNRELLELDLGDAVLFVRLQVRDRGSRIEGTEIREVLELRNRYLREHPS